MACLDRDFAAYLVMESQRGELGFDPIEASDNSDADILDHALTPDSVYSSGDDLTKTRIRRQHGTLAAASTSDEQQVIVRWGAIQSSRNYRTKEDDVYDLDRRFTKRVTITVVDVTPDYFDRIVPATGGITLQSKSILRVFVEYKNEQIDSDIAAAWECKLEEFFSKKHAPDFPGAAVYHTAQARTNAIAGGVSWHIRNSLDLVKRDASFVGLPLHLAGFYRLVDGMRVDSAVFSVSNCLIDPVNLQGS